MLVTLLAEGLGWPEGPAALPDGSLAFVETYLGRVSVWSQDGGVHEHAHLGGGPNSVIATPEGTLIVAQNGGIVGPWTSNEPRTPSIQRVGADGMIETLANSIDGITLRAPNDLVLGKNGRIYFTDAGGHYDAKARPFPGAIFALDPDGTGECLAELPPVYPNGITLDENGCVVWVESYTRLVRRLLADGTIITIGSVSERSVPDGVKTTADGRLFICGCGSSGIEVLDPSGAQVGFIAVGKVPTNCAFSGGDDLIVTDAGHHGLTTTPALVGRLWRIEGALTGEIRHG